MKKALLISLAIALIQAFYAVNASAQVTQADLIQAYNYAYTLFKAEHFQEAKDIYKKVASISSDNDLCANALYYYSQCSFRTEDYDECVKSLSIMAVKFPQCAPISKGYVARFCVFLIGQVAQLQTHWDYFRYAEGTDEKNQIVWKESIPPGFKIKRINFKLGFGLYGIMNRIMPSSPYTINCKKELDNMLDSTITMVWVDEKAAVDKWGHPNDFFSVFSTKEMKAFSKVICDRMFFNWTTDKFYLFLNMYDDIRNAKPRFIAKTKQMLGNTYAGNTAGAPNSSTQKNMTPAAQQDPTAVLTLRKLLQVAGYNPWNDTYSSVIESSPSDLSL